MTATEELRHLLEARGVRWWEPKGFPSQPPRVTHWVSRQISWAAVEGEGGLWLTCSSVEALTTGQAVEATLGSGGGLTERWDPVRYRRVLDALETALRDMSEWGC